jgi:hypothetical protein
MRQIIAYELKTNMLDQIQVTIPLKNLDCSFTNEFPNGL